MNRYFCVSVTLVEPFFHGKYNEETAEWPPTPLRLFQALVAGSRIRARGRQQPVAVESAFRWLEERNEPPYIICPPENRLGGYDFFVPRNEVGPRQDRLTTKRVRPHYVVGEPRLHYLWSIRDSEWQTAQSHIEVLSGEAKHLHALGWGIDMACASGCVVTPSQLRELTGVHWQTWRGFSSPLPNQSRIPVRGTLAELDSNYQSFVASTNTARAYSVPSKLSVFKEVTYVRSDSLPARPYVAFRLESARDEERGPAFPQIRTSVLAAMLRSLACKAAKNDPHWRNVDTEKYVAGHAGDAEESLPRFSYLPLPSIGHPYADGLIRRALIAEPYGAAGQHSRWLKRRLNHSLLLDEETRTTCALLAPIDDRSDGVLPSYLAPARTWCSVTPVILPGQDDHKQLKAEKLLIKAIAQAGIDSTSIAELRLQKAPFWHGSQHPRYYSAPSHLRHLPRWHVVVRFRKEIVGPLSVGAGRHCGLGVFAHE
jgi:CRISPR-associated protein Csb2